MSYKTISPLRIYNTTGAALTTTALTLNIPVCVKYPNAFLIKVVSSFTAPETAVPVLVSYCNTTLNLVDIKGENVTTASLATGSVIMVVRVCGSPSTLMMVNFVNPQ